MSDSVERLNAALEGRYRIESELGEGRLGVLDYIVKPLDWQRVEMKLERLFRRIGHPGSSGSSDVTTR